MDDDGFGIFYWRRPGSEGWGLDAIRSKRMILGNFGVLRDWIFWYTIRVW